MHIHFNPPRLIIDPLCLCWCSPGDVKKLEEDKVGLEARYLQEQEQRMKFQLENEDLKGKVRSQFNSI